MDVCRVLVRNERSRGTARGFNFRIPPLLSPAIFALLEYNISHPVYITHSIDSPTCILFRTLKILRRMPQNAFYLSPKSKTRGFIQLILFRILKNQSAAE